jgi:hypothetical protein
MAYFKATLENKTKGKNFNLTVKYYSKTSEGISFSFRNANKGLEAQDLKIEDKDGNIIEPKGRGSITTKTNGPIVTTITDTEPFVYEMKTEIIHFWGNRIALSFITAGYELNKGVPYYFYLIYEDEQTNKVEITF